MSFAFQFGISAKAVFMEGAYAITQKFTAAQFNLASATGAFQAVLPDGPERSYFNHARLLAKSIWPKMAVCPGGKAPDIRSAERHPCTKNTPGLLHV
jgi:hypothetical protein